MLGIRGRLRSRRGTGGRGFWRQVRDLGSARCFGPQVASGRRPVVRADTVFDVGDHPPIRRRTTRTRRRGGRHAHRARPLLRRARSRCARIVGWSAATRRLQLVHRRARKSALAFRWAADHDDLDAAAAIAVYAAFLGTRVEQYEPVAWAEERIEPARTVKHRRLAQLYSMAAQCYAAGRSGGAVRYADAALGIIESGHFDAIPYEGEAWLGGAEAVTRYRQTRQAVSGPVGGLAIIPPLRAADRPPGNLRTRNTTFIGREVELADLEQVLKTHQLVTLTGVAPDST